MMIPLRGKMRSTGAEVAGVQRSLLNNGIIAYFSAYTEERCISCLLPRTYPRTKPQGQGQDQDLSPVLKESLKTGPRPMTN